MDPDVDQKLEPFIRSARDTGVPHLVLLSALGVDQIEETPLRRLEYAVIESGIPWTILRPNFFMENFTGGFVAPMIREQNAIFLAAGTGRTSFVSADDIAAVAATAFDQGGSGKEYSLTGSEALDHGQVAEMISAAIGRTVLYHDLPEEVMLQGMRDQGFPESAVHYLRVLYAGVRAGHWAEIFSDFREVTGKEPMTFRKFVEVNREVWKAKEDGPTEH
jgi:uncharacterized protein YbjT (DUF2867 family)